MHFNVLSFMAVPGKPYSRSTNWVNICSWWPISSSLPHTRNTLRQCYKNATCIQDPNKNASSSPTPTKQSYLVHLLSLSLPPSFSTLLPHFFHRPLSLSPSHTHVHIYTGHFHSSFCVSKIPISDPCGLYTAIQSTCNPFGIPHQVNSYIHIQGSSKISILWDITVDESCLRNVLSRYGSKTVSATFTL